MGNESKTQKIYDHRLIELVRLTKDPQIAMDEGVPRSTAYRWVNDPKRSVVSLDLNEESRSSLEMEVLKLQNQVKILSALLKVLIVTLRVTGFSLAQMRVPEGRKKLKLMASIEQAMSVIPLKKLLCLMGISVTRYHSWMNKDICDLEDQSSCPKSMPQRLTPDEIRDIKEMVTSYDYRHVPTGTLGRLAQRLGKVYASASTWYRLVRERRWRRLRSRIHPEKPRLGIRATKPNEFWHIDTTIIRLLDGSKVYLHGVIDNYSRKILGWRVSSKFEIQNSANVLLQAIGHIKDLKEVPTLLADGGVENYNSEVDALIESGLLSRVLAQVEITYSNSMALLEFIRFRVCCSTLSLVLYRAAQ